MNRKTIDYFKQITLPSIYRDINLLDVTELKQHKETFINSGEYLPVLIRRGLGDDYYMNIISDFKIYSKIKQTSNYTVEESVDEFLKWIDTHKEYQSLLNKDEVLKLNERLDELDKELDILRKLK